ncbi:MULTISPECIES: hypothetical protein [Chromobacterium]|uniref:Uncharacterized protein n=1 Tax=Chromobacterium fluminis TaxID=3044269 RepID=A0ABX0L423_9NEIS|nr:MULTISPECIES: hypothetical protein [Chromobacterium]NHR05708.1 hypothetical protein [Chromobacterium haemolyticum]UJB34008.1 hypothetical protein HQN78_24895 [Chromobacterium sp. Beijing]
MRQLRAYIAALLLAMTAVSAQAAPASVPVRDVTDQLVARMDGKPMTADMLRRAIIAGAGSKGWVVVADGEGKLLASLDVRGKHQAKVAISYGADRYSVKYLSANNLNVETKSENKNYSGAAEKAPVGTVLIHPNYNRWVSIMVQEIQASANQIAP